MMTIFAILGIVAFVVALGLGVGWLESLPESEERPRIRRKERR